MAAKRTKRESKPAAEPRRESGLPGGGQGRIDAVGRSGVYPASGPHPGEPAEGRPFKGGSELIYFEGKTLLGGAPPPPSGPPAVPGPHAAEWTVPPRKPRGAKPRRRRNQPEAGRGEDGTITKPTRKPARRANGGKA